MTLNRLKNVIIGLLALIGLLFVLVTFTPLIKWWAYMLAGPWRDPGGDILIVLGAAEPTNDNILADNSYLRSMYGVRANRRSHFRSIYVVGGSTHPGAPPISAAMKEFMQFEGVPPGTILTEETSTSTRTNALNTARLLAAQPGTKVLLTSDFHMYRAHRAFSKAGLITFPHPVPDAIKRAGTWKGRWPAFLDILEETAKIAYYRAKGWI